MLVTVVSCVLVREKNGPGDHLRPHESLNNTTVPPSLVSILLRIVLYPPKHTHTYTHEQKIAQANIMFYNVFVYRPDVWLAPFSNGVAWSSVSIIICCDCNSFISHHLSKAPEIEFIYKRRRSGRVKLLSAPRWPTNSIQTVTEQWTINI